MAATGTAAKGYTGEYGAAKKKAVAAHTPNGNAAAIAEGVADYEAEEAAEAAPEVYWDPAARADEMAWAGDAVPTHARAGR